MSKQGGGDKKQSQRRSTSYQDRRGLEEKGSVSDDREASMIPLPPEDEKKMAALDKEHEYEKKMAAVDKEHEYEKKMAAMDKEHEHQKKTAALDKEQDEIKASIKESKKLEEEVVGDKSITSARSAATGSSSVMIGAIPSRPRRPARDSQIGAQAVGGSFRTGDIETGTVVVGGTAVCAQPVAHDDGLEDEIRQEIQEEIHNELRRAQIPTAQEIDRSTVTPKKPENSSFWTKRRVLIVELIAIICVVGIVAGLMTGGNTEEEADPTTFVGTSEDGERFADYIVMSKDGRTLAAGSDKASYARVFRRDESTNEWKQLGQTLVGDGQFGRAMDFNRNGSMLIVGSWSNDDFAEKAGKAQVFQFNGTEWDPIGQELFGDASQDRFGYFVAMSDNGNRIAVSARNADPTENATDAGIVRVYDRHLTSGDWTQVGQDMVGEDPEEQFGKRIAINADGTRLAVSAIRWNSTYEKQGRIRTFDYEGGGWMETIKQLDGLQAEGWWGSALSMTPDGQLLAVGSDGADDGGEDSGYVGVYQLDEDEWKIRGTAIVGPEQVRLGIRGVPLSDDGSCLAAGGSHFYNRTGIGYLFQWKNETWQKVVEVVGNAPGDRFGGSSTISGDCKWVAWGANQKESEDGSGYFRVFAVEDLI